VNDCIVMDYSDYFVFSEFPTFRWFTSFGESGLWILLKWIFLVIVTRSMYP